MIQARRITRDHYREIVRRRRVTNDTSEFYTRFIGGRPETMLVAEQESEVIELFKKYHPHADTAEIAAVVTRAWNDGHDSGTVWFLVTMDREDLKGLTFAQMRLALAKAMAHTPSQVRDAVAGKAA